MSLELGLQDLFAPTQDRRLSKVLRDLDQNDGQHISLGDLITGLKDRSVAPLMVLLRPPMCCCLYLAHL